jgi:hypothetical protein
MAAAAPVTCFYFLQGEAGESEAHPNAFRMDTGGARPLVRNVWDAFPLRGQGSFHMRFRVAAGASFVYLDPTSGEAPVPLVGGNVFAKVLRLGAWARERAAPGRGRETSVHVRASSLCPCQTMRAASRAAATGCV